MTLYKYSGCFIYMYYMLCAPALLDLFKCFENYGWKTNVPKAYIVLKDQFGCHV